MDRKYLAELVDILKQKRLSKDGISKLKIRLCTKHKVKDIPTDIELLLAANTKDLPLLLPLLQTKPVRSLSGVSVCAIMTKPRKCPHGKCSYCPGGPKSVFGTVPQSYTGKEPATRRAIRNSYDPYLQVFNRLEQYVCAGHLPEKLEVIIMGGTFPSYPRAYQTQFVSYLFKAMNDFSKEFFADGVLDIKKFKDFFVLPGKLDDNKRAATIRNRVLKLKTGKMLALVALQKKNETSMVRCVGMTIETRPDCATLSDADFMLSLGCTRVELGVQSLDDSILSRVDRGHTVADTVLATKTLKDLGFKINYHMMPGLPGATGQQDIDMFHTLFSDQRFQPDMLKIYPCMVMPGTKLFDQYKKGLFRPLSTERAAKIIASAKAYIPEYVRIMRVQRDIPTEASEAGVDRTNLRQYVDVIMKKTGISCRCIRCREIGDQAAATKPSIQVTEYAASNGTEFFIQHHSDDWLLGFCRLRFPTQSLRKEITKDSAIIRELHVYGQTARIGDSGIVQHRGFGKTLLARAESIAKSHKKKKMVIISGIGVRGYYRKLGYRRQGPYMVKSL